MAELLTTKQKSAIARAIQKPELRPILFRKAVGLNWFDAFEEAGFLTPADIPPPTPTNEEGYVTIPHWPITDYLVAASDRLCDPRNEDYAKRFIAFIRTATAHAKQQGFGNYRTWWQFSKILRNIPPYLVTQDDMASIDYWLDDKYERGLVAEEIGTHWLIKLLDEDTEHCKALALNLLRLLCEMKFIEKRYGDSNRKEAVLRFDGWHAKNVIDKAATRTGRVLGRQAVDVFRSALERILEALNNDNWSTLWRAAIENHEQNHSELDPEDVVVQGMRDSLLAFAMEAPQEATDYVSELLNSRFNTIKRVAIYCIDQRYQQLGALVRYVISDSYFTSHYQHELWHLLNNHYQHFLQDDRSAVLKVIEGFVETDEENNRNDSATAYKQARWLKAIQGYGDKEASLYRDCVNMIGGEPEHPDFSSYMTTGWVVHESPIPMDELLAMDVVDLVGRLSTYRDPGKFREPGIEGLTKALRKVIKAAPTRYFMRLDRFVNLDFPYVYEVLEAYGELWSEKAQLPWDELWQHLLLFCERVIQHDDFWREESNQQGSHFVANRNWIVGSIGRLIESGTKSDEHAFSERLVDQAMAILLVLLGKQKGEEFKPDSDAVFIAINSPRGRCLEALINLSLRTCRLADKTGHQHLVAWKRFEPFYDEELRRADGGEYEFVTLIANYLPNFLYMSNEWVQGNLEKIFSKSNYQAWICAMNGYVYVSTIYEGIYKHLKSHDHFQRALDDENLRERVMERIVQNIAVAFVNQFESLDDASSLIYLLLERRRSEEISQLIWFLWSQRKAEGSKVQSKVLELWPRLLSVIDVSKREGRKLASRLSTWSVFIDKIDDRNKNLILAVADFAEDDYNSHDLLEMIARIVKTQPLEACEIWLRLLTHAAADFPEEAVKAALQDLWRSGAEGKRKAKEIVSAYLKAGNERPSIWLSEIPTT